MHPQRACHEPGEIRGTTSPHVQPEGSEYEIQVSNGTYAAWI
jgi:hypothetical protein